MAPMLALPDGKGDFVKCSDASHKGLGCVLMQHGKKELNICQRRQLELIKNNDWEILYHSGKANMVADALSKKERLEMIMSFGEFIRDFEKMEIEVKARQADNRCYLLEAIWIDLNLNKDAIMKLGIDYRGGKDEYDNLSRKYDLIYSWKDAGKAKEVADTLKDEVVERKMLGSAVVQRTKDMIDLIRERLVVAQDGHDTKGQRV
ncbi:hypothetical protein AgCh_021004 [Apium graveolens]